MEIPDPEIPPKPPVDDHILPSQEIACGYCGHAFSGNENRIEKTIFGVKWVFCSETCLNDFNDASGYVDSDQEPDNVIIKSDPEDKE